MQPLQAPRGPAGLLT